MNDAGTKQIPGLIGEYMDILRIHGEGPIVEVHDNLGAKTLGVARRSSRDTTTFIEIQKKILAHPRTLERVIAHEMIHHAQYEAMSLEQMRSAARGRGGLSDGHGEDFKQMAARINAVKGEDFVTEKSDQDYELAPNTRQFFVLIEPVMNDTRIGWSWAARLSTQMKAGIERRDKAVLVMSVDERFLTGTKIKRFAGCSLSGEGSELESDLWDLYHEAHNE
jgi:hypothetical protein